MYGTTATHGTTAAVLAATGLTIGTWVLTVAGIIFAAVGLWMLVKANSKTRP